MSNSCCKSLMRLVRAVKRMVEELREDDVGNSEKDR